MKTVEAEKQLMQPFNSPGSYLVRYSETIPGAYALSVRSEEKVVHYRIKKEDGAHFIARQVNFKTLQELVAYYSQQADGLCVKLKSPCLLSEKPQTAGLSKHTKDEWEIDRCQIRLVQRLGAGHFGEVWEGLWSNTTSVAVKTLKPGTVSSQELLQEAAFMKKIRHQKLIQLYAVCTKEEPIYIITELMKHGSLLQYLRGEGRSLLKLPQLIDICAQVASGMAYLEQQNYIHRDLAARNILVGDHMICKVADFRLARVIDEDIYKAPTGEKLPIKWTAPEAAMHNRFSIKSDVWSFGIVIYEVITYGWFPYPGMTNAQVLEALQQGYRMPRPMGCPDMLYDIMLDCWKEEPSNRLTFETLQWQLEEFFTVDDSRYRDPALLKLIQ